MASNSNNSRPPSARKGNRNRHRGKKGGSKALPSYNGPAVLCSICGKNIRDMSSAIAEQKSGDPAHFDCVIKDLAKQETIKENEKIVYLGNGKFGIIHYDNNQNKNFKILKEIDYEKREEYPPDWRNTLKKEIL